MPMAIQPRFRSKASARVGVCMTPVAASRGPSRARAQPPGRAGACADDSTNHRRRALRIAETPARGRPSPGRQPDVPHGGRRVGPNDLVAKSAPRRRCWSMSTAPRSFILVMVWIAGGCAGGKSPGGAPVGGGPEEPEGTGGSLSGTGGRGTGGSGGGSVTPDAGSGTTPDAKGGEARDASGGATEDASTDPGGTRDGGSAIVDSGTPMSVDGSPPPSYEGQIPIYYGPAVGPIVKMDCPEDPTAGWTEYQDSFNVQRPYNIPINTRFSITNGIYNFWVFPNDFPHAPDAGGRNPRTEARYGGTADKATGGNFQSGARMYSAD